MDEPPPNKVVGYCEACDYWTEFDTKTDPWQCERCAGRFSSRIGYQITTQRTFNPKLARKKIKR